MTEQTASRTLVKSPPELWAEVSEPGSLARHLGEFGEIRITRLEGESTVAWEGERASGTVELAPSGWGTRVTLTAREAGSEPEPVAPEPEPVAVEPEPEAVEPVAEAVEPEPVTKPEPEAVEPVADAEPDLVAVEPVSEGNLPRAGLFARLFRRRRAEALAAEPSADPEPSADVEPEPVVDVEPDAVAEAEPVGVAEPEPEVAEPEPEAAAPDPEPVPDTLAALTGALDSLGAAHHRPFSRG